MSPRNERTEKNEQNERYELGDGNEFCERCGGFESSTGVKDDMNETNALIETNEFHSVSITNDGL